LWITTPKSVFGRYPRGDNFAPPELPHLIAPVLAMRSRRWFPVFCNSLYFAIAGWWIRKARAFLKAPLFLFAAQFRFQIKTP